MKLVCEFFRKKVHLIMVSWQHDQIIWYLFFLIKWTFSRDLRTSFFSSNCFPGSPDSWGRTVSIVYSYSRKYSITKIDTYSQMYRRIRNQFRTYLRMIIRDQGEIDWWKKPMVANHDTVPLRSGRRRREVGGKKKCRVRLAIVNMER
jgi:hypothetical protein